MEAPKKLSGTLSAATSVGVRARKVESTASNKSCGTAMIGLTPAVVITPIIHTTGFVKGAARPNGVSPRPKFQSMIITSASPGSPNLFGGSAKASGKSAASVADAGARTATSQSNTGRPANLTPVRLAGLVVGRPGLGVVHSTAPRFGGSVPEQNVLTDPWLSVDTGFSPVPY